MRPKDKARMSLIETSVPKLASTLQGTVYTNALCLLYTNSFGRKGCQSSPGKRYELFRTVWSFYIYRKVSVAEAVESTCIEYRTYALPANGYPPPIWDVRHSQLLRLAGRAGNPRHHFSRLSGVGGWPMGTATLFSGPDASSICDDSVAASSSIGRRSDKFLRLEPGATRPPARQFLISLC
jgi:hypothetical protein